MPFAWAPRCTGSSASCPARGPPRAGSRASCASRRRARAPRWAGFLRFRLSCAIRLGTALYKQQRIVPGTRPAARWLTRVLRIKKARPMLQRVFGLRASGQLHMGAVRLGAALYGQQHIVPGTGPAARWLTRVVRIKKARPALPRAFLLRVYVRLHMGAVRLGAALYGQPRIVPGKQPTERCLCASCAMRRRAALPGGRVARD